MCNRFSVDQRIYPVFPILATHHGDRVRDLFVIGGLDGDFVDLAVGGVEVFVRVGLADRLEDGFENLTEDDLTDEPENCDETSDVWEE